VAEAGLQAVGRHAKLARHVSLNDWATLAIQRAVERFQASQQRGLSFLATVGSTSPFIGLFGTVWGIYHALSAIGLTGQASIDKVAGPVGEALIMTAAGLAVAIPAVLAYNLFGKWVGAAEAELEGFAHDLREMRIDQAK
jgi:biopolymer transport protein ExbB